MNLYSIFIRWNGDPTFRVPVMEKGTDPRDAARRRALHLATPLKYDDVLVLGYYGQTTRTIETATIYSIAELLTVGDLVPDIQSGNGPYAPKRRYGWRP